MNVVCPNIRWSFVALQKMKKSWKGGSLKQILPSCPQVNKNLECLVLQPCHPAFLSWYMVHLDSVKLWQVSWVVHHPLWYQRMSVSGPRQLGRLGTRVGKYGLKRLIYCSNIIMYSWKKECGDLVKEMLKMASGMNFFYATCMWWLYKVIL